MSTAEIEVVEAFTSIGVPPDRAMKAAAALNRRDGLIEISALKTDVAVLKWMVGFVMALSLAILVKLFIH